MGDVTMKNLFWIYAIPHIYLINWLQFFSYGAFAAILSFALFFLPFVVCFIWTRKENWITWMKGSALQFTSNMVLTLITNQFSIVSESGGTWRGATGVFYAEQFVLVLTLFGLFLQLFFLAPFWIAGNSDIQSK